MNAQEKKELRIKVAKDVLKSLNLYKVASGEVFVRNNNIDLNPYLKKRNSKLIAQRLKKDCEVCALGACFLSLVKLDNKFNFFDGYDSYDDIPNGFMPDAKPFFRRLKNIFSVSQLILIESSFELGEGFFNEVTYVDWLARDSGISAVVLEKNSKSIPDAVAFGGQFENDSERLAAIMKNIIKNEGRFIPF